MKNEKKNSALEIREICYLSATKIHKGSSPSLKY